MVEAVEEEVWCGIDLGTSNSVLGCWKNNQYILQQDPESNSCFTPSVIRFKNDESCIVGNAAVN